MSSNARPKLVRQIKQAIADNGGWLSFADFMALALYAPETGYYNAPPPKFGRHGDFVTAPELSPLFAACIGNFSQQILAPIANTASILELGAGTGSLARNLLDYYQQNTVPTPPYYIIEPSPSLRTSQQALLKGYNVTWLDEWPQDFTGLIVANEVLDALPVHCLEIGPNQTIYERGISYQDNNFVWSKRLLGTEPWALTVTELVAQHKLAPAYLFEYSSAIPELLAQLSATITQGVVLLIDYGYEQQEYYHPQRTSGNLKCYTQHIMHHDPLQLVGAQDITTNLNFTAVAQQAQATGLDLAYYLTQSEFLLNNGLMEMASNIFNTNDLIATYQTQQALKTLLLPSEMGTTIKAMILAKNWPYPLPALDHADISCRL